MAIYLKIAVFLVVCSLGVLNRAQAEESSNRQSSDAGYEELAEQREEAQETVSESAKVAKQMATNNDIKQLLNDAKGVFLIPDFGRAGLVVGGKGGEGVLMKKENNKWVGPAFYNIGGVSVGVQAGVEAGAIAFVLMNDKAMENFKGTHNFSLKADAGLTIVDFSERGQAAAGAGDIVVWSDAEGVWGDLALAIEDIVWDGEENRAYYQKTFASPENVFGLAQKNSQQSDIARALK